MTRFNLSAWAISHRSLVYYLMLVLRRARYRLLSAARAATRIPPSPSRQWWSRRNWPGATLDDTLLQVTERHGAQASGDAAPRLPEKLH